MRLQWEPEALSLHHPRASMEEAKHPHEGRSGLLLL